MSDPIPVRPRARTFTPARVVLSAVLLVAAGFIGGVEVQKRSSSSGSGGGGAAAARFAGRFTGSASRDTASGSGAITGQVANKHGKTLYVTESGGTTVKVRITSSTKVTRTAVSHVHAVHPGDTVVVQGSTASSGTVKATSLTATASNAPSALGGFGGPAPSGG
jgi:hypothetical protein